MTCDENGDRRAYREQQSIDERVEAFYTTTDYTTVPTTAISRLVYRPSCVDRVESGVYTDRITVW